MSRILAVATLAALLLANPAGAQSTANPTNDSNGIGLPGGFSGRGPAQHLRPEQAAAFAKQIEQNLAAHDAHLAIVFRAGRARKDLPDNIAYTHGAFWVYGQTTGADGKTYKGYAVYNLYQGDGRSLPVTESYLARDYPIDFVAGSQADDVGVIIPSPEMQRRIEDIINSPSYEKLHIKSYTLVSNPFDARHQNCTEFLLDVVAAAAWQTDDYAQLKANLKAHFTPTVIHAGLLQRVFGPVFDPRLNLDDQDDDIETAEYASIARFMKDNTLLQESYVLNRDIAVAN
jgi:hypothetical protein